MSVRAAHKGCNQSPVVLGAVQTKRKHIVTIPKGYSPI